MVKTHLTDSADSRKKSKYPTRKLTTSFCHKIVVVELSTVFAFRFEHRKWNRGRNGLRQLGQPVAPSVPFPVFKSEGEPGNLN